MSPAPPLLTFDWSRRSRSWLRLSGFIVLMMMLHVAAFYVFTVQLPEPSRVMPPTGRVSLAGVQPDDPTEVSRPYFPLGVPLPAAGLELPPATVSGDYQPSYQGHRLDYRPWPEKPAPLTWPDVSGMTQPVLPPTDGRP